MLFLCIDDDPDDMELLCDGIKTIDPSFVCITAANGKEGLDLLQTFTPDAIFLDINMPVMDGRETLLTIRRQPDYRYIPVYILSTTSNRAEVNQFKHLGARDFITKPDSFQELCARLKAVLEHFAI
jgi:CheY-like chemotaxis protein